MSNRKPIRVGLVIGGVVALLIVIATIYGNYKRTHYPAEYGAAFITNCTNSGASSNKCVCMLDYIKEQYTYEESLAMVERADPKELSTIKYLACGSVW